MQSIRDRVAEWHQLLPGVDLHYAMKSNNDPMILTEMIRLGQNFDCASQGEINKILSLGAKP